MDLIKAFGIALRDVRQQRGLTQEDFSIVSSRTYLSTLERGLKGPTLEKIEQLSGVLKVHPLTLIAEAFLHEDPYLNPELLLSRVRDELKVLRSEPAGTDSINSHRVG
ncbi:helix-turn-helix domain-containing protein [Pseudomonas knackmussii]|uniref:helix-turn-helix domain-containing protein n=1 Tax=Pseudomonas knackmussii TaxID=65741 RepID=UPI003F49F4C7